LSYCPSFFFPNFFGISDDGPIRLALFFALFVSPMVDGVVLCLVSFDQIFSFFFAFLQRLFRTGSFFPIPGLSLLQGFPWSGASAREVDSTPLFFFFRTRVAVCRPDATLLLVISLRVRFGAFLFDLSSQWFLWCFFAFLPPAALVGRFFCFQNFPLSFFPVTKLWVCSRPFFFGGILCSLFPLIRFLLFCRV